MQEALHSSLTKSRQAHGLQTTKYFSTPKQSCPVVVGNNVDTLVRDENGLTKKFDTIKNELADIQGK